MYMLTCTVRIGRQGKEGGEVDGLGRKKENERPEGEAVGFKMKIGERRGKNNEQVGRRYKKRIKRRRE